MRYIRLSAIFYSVTTSAFTYYSFAGVHFKLEDLVEQYVRETIEYRTELTEDTIPKILRLEGVEGFDSSGKAT